MLQHEEQRPENRKHEVNVRPSRCCPLHHSMRYASDSRISLYMSVGERQGIAHKGVRAIVNEAGKPKLEMAKVLQNPVFALGLSTDQCEQTFLCDTLWLADMFKAFFQHARVSTHRHAVYLCVQQV